MTFSYLRFSEYGIDWTSVLSDIDQSFYTAIGSAVAYYKDQYQALNAWGDVEDTGFQVQRYEERNGYYRPHVDSLPGTNTGDRVLAAMIYLNTVDEGGETRFPLHEVSIKPVAGRVVLFPATWTHLHEGLTPLSGDKWIINGAKTWSTSAFAADYGLLLARTNWEVPKHEGLTMFLVPIKTSLVLLDTTLLVYCLRGQPMVTAYSGSCNSAAA